MIVPWNSEHHPPVAGVRYHDGAVARNKGSIEYQMDSLTGSNDLFHRRVCLAAKIVAECADGVDNHFALSAKLRACFCIVSDYAVNVVINVFYVSNYIRIDT